mmetsp:Transcript_22227/g.44582  ORF Transcript_22227/g.44582 Transcript_22227/m.44582 type:complete len:95 (+) Transcript_22227:1677-1961(+)
MHQKCIGLFQSLGPVGGKLTGQQAKGMLMKSGLPVEQLRDIWRLSDIDRDGKLDADEFTVAMFLIDSLRRKRMTQLPQTLPYNVIPPSKRTNPF